MKVYFPWCPECRETVIPHFPLTLSRWTANSKIERHKEKYGHSATLMECGSGRTAQLMRNMVRNWEDKSTITAIDYGRLV